MASRCSVCPDEGQVQAPDRPIYIAPNRMSCQHYEDMIAPFDEGDCVDQNSGSPIDLAAYCECPGIPTPQACDFCLGGTIVNPDQEVLSPGFRLTLKCEEAGILTEYITDPGLCAELKLSFASTCCLFP